MQVHIRYFHCPVCHKVMVAPKHKNFKKEKKHRKNMWCPFCKEERRFILDEVTKIDFIKKIFYNIYTK